MRRNAAREHLGQDDAEEMIFYYDTPDGDRPEVPPSSEPDIIGYSPKQNVYYTCDFEKVVTQQPEIIDLKSESDDTN